MEVWRIILYGTAALLALKSLSSLMTAFRTRVRAEFEQAARDQESAAAKPATPQDEKPAGKRTAA